ncbi:uncharacterized protein LOC118459399 [Anopheles albimanus]|nr:uncharacterized protein LOC118459399 [Anopheles albimanus]XP_035778607.1 uncharacterized protein LOC118459399 [Anopheles albimanus]XP_035778616.1 uncharacterized protein LOC118459399 [Anopheles albimanus]XP_035778627.1 uncharacterized protein LOC118459399 [Anopheles albimanus]XP_035778638.1 uncharacterized protein LOC118459399 [Anopheles albimanus]XP_035778648.1 uncharacterized protein LOC118459399 [Anopheles albimanus]XP_035778657.1 uncharacterized protein LOC118459399 [Anopheles albimanu
MKQETAQDDVSRPNRPNAMLSAVESMIPAGGRAGAPGGYTPPHHHHLQQQQQQQHHHHYQHSHQQQQQHQQQPHPFHHHHHRHHPMALASASLLNQLPLAAAIPPLLATAPCYPHSSPMASAGGGCNSSSSIVSASTTASEFARPFPKQRYEDTRMGISSVSERRSKYSAEAAPVSPSSDYKARATPLSLSGGQSAPGGPVNLALGVGGASAAVATVADHTANNGGRPGSNGRASGSMLTADTQWSHQGAVCGIEPYKSYSLATSRDTGSGAGSEGDTMSAAANLHHPKALSAVQHHIQQRQHQQHQQLQQQQQLLRNDYVERSLKAQQKQQHLYHGEVIDANGDLAKAPPYPASVVSGAAGAGDGRQLPFFNPPPALDVTAGGYAGLNYGLFPYRGILGRPVYTAAQRISEQQYGTVASPSAPYRAYGSSTDGAGAGAGGALLGLGSSSSSTDGEHKSFAEPSLLAITGGIGTSTSSVDSSSTFPGLGGGPLTTERSSYGGGFGKLSSLAGGASQHQQHHQHHRQQPPVRYHPTPRYAEHGEEQHPSPGVPVSSPNDPSQKTHFSYQHPAPSEQPPASVAYGSTRYDISSTTTIFPRDEVDEQLIDEYRRALHQLKHQQQVQQQQQQQQQQQEFKVPCGGKDGPLKSRFLHQRPNGSSKSRQPTHSSSGSSSGSISAIEEIPCTGSAVASNHTLNGYRENSDSGTTVTGEATFSKGSLIEFGNGESKRIEDVRAEDLIRTAEQSSDLRLTEAIVRAITLSDSAPAADPTAGDALHMILVTFSYDREQYISKVEASFEYPFFVLTKGWASYSPSETLTKYNLHCKPLLVGDTFFALVAYKSLQCSSSQQSIATDGGTTPSLEPLGTAARKQAKKRSGIGSIATGAPLRRVSQPTNVAAEDSRSCERLPPSQQPEDQRKPLPLTDWTYLAPDRQQQKVRFEPSADGHEGGDGSGGGGAAAEGCCDDEDDRKRQQLAKKRPSNPPASYEDVSRRKRKPQRLSLSENSSSSSMATGN